MENCPACYHKIVDNSLAFCKNCNWELMFISENASQSLKDYYDQKLAYHKTTINLNKKAEEDRLASLDKIAGLEKQVEEIGLKNKELAENAENTDKVKKTIGTLNKEIETKDNAIKKLRGDLADEKAAHEATKTKNIFGI